MKSNEIFHKNGEQVAISIVIVTYNSSRVIENCLRGISADDTEIIVVDNASRDSTVRQVRSSFPAVTVIENDNNDGFARAVNEGVRRATADFVLLLNPDCYISLDNIRALVQTMVDRPIVGVVGPKLVDGTNEIPTITAGHFPTLWRMFVHMTGISRFAKGRRRFEGHYLFDGDLNESTRNVDWVTGGCMLIRRSVWDELDGLTNRWFMYAEDIEFCWRVIHSGNQILLDPRVEAIHEMGGSSGDVDGRANVAWLLNLYDFVCWRIYQSTLKRNLWRQNVIAGFKTRYIALKVASLVLPADRAMVARRRSQLFNKYASALMNIDDEPRKK